MRTLLNVFEDFYDDLPQTVRDDLSFMMVRLSDETLAVEELEDYENDARSLFRAQTFAGRMSQLINAVSIFDVYFALDPNERLGLFTPESDGLRDDASLSPVHQRYSDRRRAITAAKQVWMELRQTTLGSAAIATTLVPKGISVKD